MIFVMLDETYTSISSPDRVDGDVGLILGGKLWYRLFSDADLSRAIADVSAKILNHATATPLIGILSASTKQEQDEAERMANAAAADTISHLQRALSSSSVPILVEALAAVDAAVASHPLLCVVHPQVVTMRNDVHTRAAAVAEDAIKAVLSFDNSGVPNGFDSASIASLESAALIGDLVPSAPHVESLRAAVANARRVAANWSLRLRKIDHTQWTCDEVVVAFTAVAHSKGLPVESIDAVVAYLSKENVDGSILSDVESDIASLVTNQARRARLVQILKLMCSSMVVGNPASAAAVSHFHHGHSASLVATTPATSIIMSANPGVGLGDASAHCDNVNGDKTVYGPALPPHDWSLSSSSSEASPSVDSSCSSSLKNLVDRLVDADGSLLVSGLSAITGIAAAEPLPFAEAVERCGIKGIELNALCAAKHGITMKNHGEGGALTADHIAAIHMYTQASDFYRTLNACLRDRDRMRIKPCLSYLRLLLDALRQLPVSTRTVYRGVKRDLSANFRLNDELVWWSLTSTSTTIEILRSKDFCGEDGPRTVFMVQAAHACDIAAFSAFASEEEYILLPGAQLKVKAVVPMGGGLHLVQMDEIGKPMSLIEFESVD
jgi:hypothetical protein